MPTENDVPENRTWIPGYKGFDKEMCCRGKKYLEETESGLPENATIKLCSSGLHYCENLMNCFEWYRPSESIFAKILDVGDRRDVGPEKNATDRIRVKKIMSTTELAKEGLECFVKTQNRVANNYECAMFGVAWDQFTCIAAASGGYSIAYSKAVERGIAATGSTGAVSIATGYNSVAAATGDVSLAEVTKDGGVAVATSIQSTARAAGDKAIALATNLSRAEAMTPGAIAICHSYKGTAKGVKGSFLVFAKYRSASKKECGIIKFVKFVTFKVDGKRILENTEYRYDGNKLIESENIGSRE